MFLTQIEADKLLTMSKSRSNDLEYTIPLPGELLKIPLESTDKREQFIFDINRGRIRLSKFTYQSRARVTIILARLDVDGPPHTNPSVDSVPLDYLQPFNGLEVPTPHLHNYVEGFMDKWAIPAPIDKFSNVSDIFNTITDFLNYCNVQRHPIIREGLFS
jgi:hypothetical protein